MNSGGGACDHSAPSAVAKRAASENLVAAGEVMHMTLAFQLQCCLWPQQTRYQQQWGLQSHHSSHGGTCDTSPPLSVAEPKN